MKTLRQVIEKLNPEQDDDSGYYYASADYKDAFYDCKILVWEEVGSYQGDYFVLVEGPDRNYGFTVIGYGSCSGCDALCGSSYGSNRSTVINGICDLFKGIRDGVHWENTKKDMKKYLAKEYDKEMKDTYFSNEKERVATWKKILKALE